MLRDAAQCYILSALNQDLGRGQSSGDTDRMLRDQDLHLSGMLSPLNEEQEEKYLLSSDIFLAYSRYLTSTSLLLI